MLSRNKIKEITRLHQKKFRNERSLFIAEGVKVADELMRSSFEIKEVYATAGWVGKSASLLRAPVTLVTAEELKRISGLVTPNEVLAVVKEPQHRVDEKLLDGSLTLLLDDISDPGNLGTMIRIADWFGVAQVICSPGSVDCFNQKVVQASMGSVFRVKVCYEDLSRVIGTLREKKVPVYGTVLDGKNIYETTIRVPCAILMGNESKGIPGDLLEKVTHPVTIPSFNAGDPSRPSEADSLNVAVAAAIFCAEARRRGSKK